MFSLVGLGMLVGSVFLYESTTAFIATAERAEGTVIELVRNRSSDSTTYAPIVEFVTAQGRKVEFRSSTSSNPPAYSRGEKVAVLYSPSSPEQAKIDGFFSVWGGTVILAGLGGVFFVIGIGIIAGAVIKRRNREYLRARGTAVTTKFKGVERNTRYKQNGRHPYVIVSQWQNPVTSKIHVFQSDNIWFDPTDHVHTDMITVYIDGKNPDKHFMDVSFLPELAD